MAPKFKDGDVVVAVSLQTVEHYNQLLNLSRSLVNGFPGLIL